MSRTTIIIMIVILLMLCVLVFGCLIGAFLFRDRLDLPDLSLSNSRTATYTSTISSTFTDVPSHTPTLIPTATVTPTQVLPTDTPIPPTATETEQPAATESQYAQVIITNNLPYAITIKLRGPEYKTVTVQALSEYEIQIQPGTYEFSLSAAGYNTLTGTRVFDPGENTWTFTNAPKP